MGLFETFGVSANPMDMRALSVEEMIERQRAQNAAMQQAVFQPDYYRRMANWTPTETRPLDERFADFKKRLSASLERHGIIETS